MMSDVTIDAQIEGALGQEKRLLDNRRVADWDRSEVIGQDGIEAGVFTGIDVNGQRWNTWHGRGVYLEDKQVLSVKEAITHVPQLGMEALDRSLGWQDEHGEWHTIKGEVANVRTDDTYLGVVTKRYKRVQPWEAFQFIDDLLDTGDAKIANAMTLRGGKQIALLAVIPEEWNILGASERFRLYLYLTNSYDRSTGLNVAITPVRVQCTNSDALALATAPRSISFRHTEGITGKIAMARDTLGLVATYRAAFTETVEQLASQKMTPGEFDRFLNQLHPLTPEVRASDRRVENRKVVIDAIRNIRDSAPNLEAIRDTRWGAFNAVSEYEDWFTKVGGKNPDEKRMQRQLNPSPVKDRALDLLLA
jgi:phage/plasmid-like protein (TIGR03299 family)